MPPLLSAGMQASGTSTPPWFLIRKPLQNPTTMDGSFFEQSTACHGSAIPDRNLLLSLRVN